MKHAAEKSSAMRSPAATRAETPFFGKKGGGDFFGPAPAGGAVQAKMALSQPGDPFEQEADKMSDRVMRAAADPSEKTQRQSAEMPQKAEVLHRFKREDDGLHHQSLTNLGEVQRQETTGGVPEIGGPLESGIKAQATGGEPLPSDLRREMESSFGADFGTVRLHTGPEAAALNAQLKARAFTYKNHIFFSRDQFQPDSREGKQLLAHELAHTIQQGQAIRRKPPPERSEDILHRATKPPKPEAVTSSEVVDLSSGTFAPSEKVQSEIEAQGHKGLEVRIIVKGLTDEGRIKVRADRKKNFDSFGRGSMPVKAPWADQLGGLHLNIRLAQSEIKEGFASLKASAGNAHDWVRALQKTTEVLGGLGLKVENLPKPVNKFEGGKLTLGVTNLKVEVGGFLDAAFNFTVENAAKPVVEASADINVKGIAKGQLKFDNTKEKLAGEISLGIEYKSFAGNALIKYNPDGTVDIGGKAGYNADRLSGTIEFVSTDFETANSFARDAIKAAGGKEKVQEAPPPAPVPAPKPGAKKRGLAATGQLAFHLTEWFAGTVFVVVDAKGDVTVIGKIAPPGEIELMKQRDWDKELIKLEAKAYYGIPVVGNINLFANVSLHAIASLGPAKIYNIEILGTYSTDPEIQKMIQISGSINISAYAGLRLRAEGGAGIEILDHDIKFGVGINVDVGVKAYVDARPTFGFRDPGVFYISGTLDMVAQPVLGLGGDFFIALETPWWSPLSDDRWTWPLFQKEWPLGDPLGISAEMKEYVLGSGKVPEIELKKPEFDPGKFMSKMVDNDMPGKSGKAGAGQGNFKEDGSVKKPEIPPKKPAPKKAEGKAPKKEPKPKAGKSAKPDPKGAKEKDSAKLLQSASKLLATLKGKTLSRSELNHELEKIKGQASGVGFDIQQKGNKWTVKPKAGGKVGKGVELNAKDLGKEAGPADGRTPAQVKSDLDKALHEVNALLGEETERGMVTRDLEPIKRRYHLTRVEIVVDKTEHGLTFYHVNLEINPIAKSKKVGELDYIDPPIEVDPRFFCKKSLNQDEFKRQIILQEKTINQMNVKQWLDNRKRFVKEGRSEEGTREQQRVRQDEINTFEVDAVAERTRAYRKKGFSKEEAEKKARGFVNKLLANQERPDGRLKYKNSQLTDPVDGAVIVNELYKKAALHAVDQIAGGEATDVRGLGGEREDYSIGAQWKGQRIDKLEKKVKQEVKGKKMEEQQKIRMSVKLTTDYEKK